MSDKWTRVRDSFSRAHDDLYSSKHAAEFFNHSQGSYDPDTGKMTGETRSSIGSIDVEIVPPAIDSTVDSDGTSFSWDTSIRMPLDESIVSSLIPTGVDNRKPTEVEVTDNIESDTTIYEVHGYSEERGSGMVMVRLIEQ